ncbi:uncharacterized protein [Notamacropus eugenii]|uniref:uncharacterized protein n=1 Tax=Notamacropus eugenii TaxID=9315 RepID=UPI003B678930
MLHSRIRKSQHSRPDPPSKSLQLPEPVFHLTRRYFSGLKRLILKEKSNLFLHPSYFEGELYKTQGAVELNGGSAGDPQTARWFLHALSRCFSTSPWVLSDAGPSSARFFQEHGAGGLAARPRVWRGLQGGRRRKGPGGLAHKARKPGRPADPDAGVIVPGEPVACGGSGGVTELSRRGGHTPRRAFPGSPRGEAAEAEPSPLPSLSGRFPHATPRGQGGCRSGRNRKRFARGRFRLACAEGDQVTFSS